MASRNDFDDFFGDDDEAPVVDTRADGRLYRVPLGRLSPNLVNPRTDFGTEDDLIDFGKSIARRQNQPCPVVSRGAYLKLWPDHSDKVGDVDYVLVSGERRYRAATAVAHPVLDCVVNDDFATDRKTFMEAVVSENVDRQNFDPVEEAYAVQALVAEFGSNRAVAQHFERADGWVTQRILLTNLAREAQALVRERKMPLDAARTLGKLARDNDWSARDQLEWWETEQEKRAAASAARAAARKASKAPTKDPGEPRFTAVKQEPVPSAAVAPPSVSPPPMPATPAGPVASPTVPRQEQTAPAPEAARPEPEPPLPPQAAAPEARQQPVKFPYDDGTFAAQLLIHRMPDTELEKCLTALKQHHEQHTTTG
ncbi:ParB/RepB/Spo0J family partition protein [Streptomyces ardesiacus]|uniref:ParB/RepB/Spo0J family partition protein n=1 Tax=Streptomyces ardesiacus TaxID=285564 RepID=UPI0036EF75D7